MSKVTVAATQMACSWDRDANVARAEKLIREAAGRGANVVLIQELFETPYFCKDHAVAPFRSREAPGGPPGGRAFPRPGARTRRGAAGERVRAREQRLLQFRGDGRCGRRGARQLPQIAHSRRARISREVLFLAGRHRLQGVRHQVRQVGRGDLLGPVVSGGRALHGADGRRNSAVSDRDRLRAAGSAAGFERALAAHHARPRGGQRHAAGGIESRRDRTGREIHHDLLRLLVHRLAHRGEASPRPTAAAKRVLTADLRPGRGAPLPPAPGACSATGARISTTRSSRSMDAAEVLRASARSGVCRPGDDRRQRRLSPHHRGRHRARSRTARWSRNGARWSIRSAASRRTSRPSPASPTRWSPTRRASPTSRRWCSEPSSRAAPVFVAHNARFDYAFLRAEFRRCELHFSRPGVVHRQALAAPVPGASAAQSGCA